MTAFLAPQHTLPELEDAAASTPWRQLAATTSYQGSLGIHFEVVVLMFSFVGVCLITLQVYLHRTSWAGRPPMRLQVLAPRQDARGTYRLRFLNGTRPSHAWESEDLDKAAYMVMHLCGRYWVSPHGEDGAHPPYYDTLRSPKCPRDTPPHKVAGPWSRWVEGPSCARGSWQADETIMVVDLTPKLGCFLLTHSDPDSPATQQAVFGLYELLGCIHAALVQCLAMLALFTHTFVSDATLWLATATFVLPDLLALPMLCWLHGGAPLTRLAPADDATPCAESFKWIRESADYDAMRQRQELARRTLEEVTLEQPGVREMVVLTRLFRLGDAPSCGPLMPICGAVPYGGNQIQPPPWAAPPPGVAPAYNQYSPYAASPAHGSGIAPACNQYSPYAAGPAYGAWNSWSPQARAPRHGKTVVTRGRADATPLELAEELNQRSGGGGVAVVSYASASSCGGKFKSGGTHGLEESLCVQTTIFPSLDRVHRMHGRAGASTYLPDDHVIISPNVEVFRKDWRYGYELMDRRVRLAAVISVPLRDSLGGLSDPHAKGTLGLKLATALSAALDAGCSALVVPEPDARHAGSDASDFGWCLGNALRQPAFWGEFKEVVLCGDKGFQDGVTSGAVVDAGDDPCFVADSGGADAACILALLRLWLCTPAASLLRVLYVAMEWDLWSGWWERPLTRPAQFRFCSYLHGFGLVPFFMVVICDTAQASPPAPGRAAVWLAFALLLAQVAYLCSDIIRAERPLFPCCEDERDREPSRRDAAEPEEDPELPRIALPYWRDWGSLRKVLTPGWGDTDPGPPANLHAFPAIADAGPREVADAPGLRPQEDAYGRDVAGAPSRWFPGAGIPSRWRAMPARSTLIGRPMRWKPQDGARVQRPAQHPDGPRAQRPAQHPDIRAMSRSSQLVRQLKARGMGTVEITREIEGMMPECAGEQRLGPDAPLPSVARERPLQPTGPPMGRRVSEVGPVCAAVPGREHRKKAPNARDSTLEVFGDPCLSAKKHRRPRKHRARQEREERRPVPATPIP